MIGRTTLLGAAIATALMVHAVTAHAMTKMENCAAEVGKHGGRIMPTEGTKLVVLLENPPRSRLTLSIDNDKGNHYELVWDPAVNDGLQHEIVLPHDLWTLTPSVEQERIVDGSVVHFVTTVFAGQPVDKNRDQVIFSGKTTVTTTGQKPMVLDVAPMLTASCQSGQLELKAIHLDHRRISAVSTARGLLDQSIPEPISSTLSLLAEIAVDRAKSQALELLRSHLITPLCDHLDLAALKLGGAEKALPHTCALLEQLRLEDALGSGHALLKAAEGDLRDTLIPALISNVPHANEQTRNLAGMATNFAGRLLDGNLDGVVEIDYMVALLDNMSWGTGLDGSADFVTAWLAASVPAGDTKIVASLERAVVEQALPDDFDDPHHLKGRRWEAIPECAGKEGASDGYYTRASRAACVDKVVATLPAATWLSVGTNKDAAGHAALFSLDAVLASARRVSGLPSFGSWIQDTWSKTIDATAAQALVANLPGDAQHALDASCGVRLVVGVVKWCSAKDTCTAGEIASVLKTPKQVFKPSDSVPEALCWNSDGSYRMPHDADRYIDLGARLVSFLNPSPKGQERARVVAMIGWMFDAVAVLAPDDQTLAQIRGIVLALIDRDYVTAATSSFALARRLACKDNSTNQCDLPVFARRAMQLLGSVASYADVYESTKQLDPAAQRDARKKALEGLIDSATQRASRGGDFIVSVGSNVAGAVTRSREYYSGDSAPHELGLRVPLGIAFQVLPRGSEPDATGDTGRRVIRNVGLHLGLQLGDLGQFARSNDSVTWSSFVAPGVEVGLLIGGPAHPITLTAFGSYVPTLTASSPPLWRYGVAIGYYVPFLDFN